MGCFFSHPVKEIELELKEPFMPKDDYCVFHDTTELIRFSLDKNQKNNCKLMYENISWKQVSEVQGIYNRYRTGECPPTFDNIQYLAERVKYHNSMVRHSSWCLRDKGQTVLQAYISDFYMKILIIHCQFTEIMLKRNHSPIIDLKPKYKVTKIANVSKKDEIENDKAKLEELATEYLLNTLPSLDLGNLDEDDDSDNKKGGGNNGATGLLIGN